MTAGTFCNTVSIQCCTVAAASLNPFLQVEAISKAMKQRAEDLKLPMPQLVVGQNIETWASPVVYQFETTHLKAGSPLFRTIPYPGKT